MISPGRIMALRWFVDMTQTVISNPVPICLCSMTLPFFSSLEGVYFLSPWIWAALVIYFGPLNVSEMTLGSFWAKAWRRLSTCLYSTLMWYHHASAVKLICRMRRPPGDRDILPAGVLKKSEHWYLPGGWLNQLLEFLIQRRWDGTGESTF